MTTRKRLRHAWAAAIVVPVVVVLITAALFLFLLKRYRKKPTNNQLENTNQPVVNDPNITTDPDSLRNKDLEKQGANDTHINQDQPTVASNTQQYPPAHRIPDNGIVYPIQNLSQEAPASGSTTDLKAKNMDKQPQSSQSRGNDHSTSDISPYDAMLQQPSKLDPGRSVGNALEAGPKPDSMAIPYSFSENLNTLHVDEAEAETSTYNPQQVGTQNATPLPSQRKLVDSETPISRSNADTFGSSLVSKESAQQASSSNNSYGSFVKNITTSENYRRQQSVGLNYKEKRFSNIETHTEPNKPAESSAITTSASTPNLCKENNVRPRRALSPDLTPMIISFGKFKPTESPSESFSANSVEPKANTQPFQDRQQSVPDITRDKFTQSGLFKSDNEKELKTINTISSKNPSSVTHLNYGESPSNKTLQPNVGNLPCNVTSPSTKNNVGLQTSFDPQTSKSLNESSVHPSEFIFPLEKTKSKNVSNPIDVKSKSLEKSILHQSRNLDDFHTQLTHNDSKSLNPNLHEKTRNNRDLDGIQIIPTQSQELDPFSSSGYGTLFVDHYQPATARLDNDTELSKFSSNSTSISRKDSATSNYSRSTSRKSSQKHVHNLIPTLPNIPPIQLDSVTGLQIDETDPATKYISLAEDGQTHQEYNFGEQVCNTPSTPRRLQASSTMSKDICHFAQSPKYYTYKTGQSPVPSLDKDSVYFTRPKLVDIEGMKQHINDFTVAAINPGSTESSPKLYSPADLVSNKDLHSNKSTGSMRTMRNYKSAESFHTDFMTPLASAIPYYNRNRGSSIDITNTSLQTQLENIFETSSKQASSISESEVGSDSVSISLIDNPPDFPLDLFNFGRSSVSSNPLGLVTSLDPDSDSDEQCPLDYNQTDRERNSISCNQVDSQCPDSSVPPLSFISTIKPLFADQSLALGSSSQIFFQPGSPSSLQTDTKGLDTAFLPVLKKCKSHDSLSANKTGNRVSCVSSSGTSYSTSASAEKCDAEREVSDVEGVLRTGGSCKSSSSLATHQTMGSCGSSSSLQKSIEIGSPIQLGIIDNDDSTDFSHLRLVTPGPPARGLKAIKMDNSLSTFSSSGYPSSSPMSFSSAIPNPISLRAKAVPLVLSSDDEKSADQHTDQLQKTASSQHSSSPSMFSTGSDNGPPFKSLKTITVRDDEIYLHVTDDEDVLEETQNETSVIADNKNAVDTMSVQKPNQGSRRSSVDSVTNVPISSFPVLQSPSEPEPTWTNTMVVSQDNTLAEDQSTTLFGNNTTQIGQPGNGSYKGAGSKGSAMDDPKPEAIKQLVSNKKDTLQVMDVLVSKQLDEAVGTSLEKQVGDDEQLCSDGKELAHVVNTNDGGVHQHPVNSGQIVWLDKTRTEMQKLGIVGQSMSTLDDSGSGREIGACDTISATQNRLESNGLFHTGQPKPDSGSTIVHTKDPISQPDLTKNPSTGSLYYSASSSADEDLSRQVTPESKPGLDDSRLPFVLAVSTSPKSATCVVVPFTNMASNQVPE